MESVIRKKRGYKVGPVDYGMVAPAGAKKYAVVPDQTLSLKEIVRRYVKGLPVELNDRQGVFVDQDEFDLEKVSRSDFAEQAELARYLRQRVDDAVRASDEERVVNERQERASPAEERASADSEAKDSEPKPSGPKAT